MIPILIGAAALFGLGAHAVACADNEEAQNNNNRANEIIERSNRAVTEANESCQYSINRLAMTKSVVLKGNMKRFVYYFSKIRPVNFRSTGNLFELDGFNKNQIVEIRQMCNTVQKISPNQIAGGVSGTLLAVGAADALAGGSLLGGVGVSVGGLAGGALLSTIAAPVFAVSGLFSASEAAANLEKSKANLEKAYAYEDECDTYVYVANSIEDRCGLFDELISEIDERWFENGVNTLEKIIYKKRTFGNFIRNMLGKKIFTDEEMATVAQICTLAKMLNRLINTNILDSDGNITDESEKVAYEMQEKIYELE